jgi:pimeloyl-ACP methyl ester carboxylesterase
MWSSTIDADGPVHVAEWGSGPARIVLVHGLGGAHLNWMRVAPQLTRYGRVLAPDLPGFGLTPVAGRPTTVAAYTALLDRVLAATCESPVVLIGNSMGGLIALLEAAQHPERVAGLVLVDAVLPGRWRQWRPRLVLASCAAYVVPSLGRRFLARVRDRLSVEELVAGALRLCAQHPERIPADVVEAHVELERRRGRNPDDDDAYVLAERSIFSALVHSAALRARLDRVSVPTLVVHGDTDRLVRVIGARRAKRRRPDWDLRVLADVGHVPMIEVPYQFLEILDDWLRAHGLGTAPVTPAAGVASPGV